MDCSDVHILSAITGLLSQKVVVVFVVLPVLDVHVTKRPHIDYATYTPEGDLMFREGGSFQWECAVTAGVGDELQWFHDEELILVTNRSGVCMAPCAIIAGVDDQHSIVCV